MIQMRKLSVVFTALLLAVGVLMPPSADAARRVPPRRPYEPRVSTASGPDFAMPRKVEKDALASLEKALKSGDDTGVVRSLADWALAKTAVSADSAGVVVARMRDIYGQVKNPVAGAMILALEARLYADIYQADRWNYDRRQTIDGVGDDFTRWSGPQFAQRIDSLVMQSLKPAAGLQATDIEAYRTVIDIDRPDMVFYPTLYDFVASQGVRNLGLFDDDGRILNARLVESPDDESLFPVAKPLMCHILQIYRDLALFHRDRAAALVSVNLDRLEYIRDHVYESDGYDEALLDNRLLAMYADELPATEQAVRYLFATSDVPDTTMYRLLSVFEKEHPAYADINAVKNRLNSLSAKMVSAYFPQSVAPGTPFKVSVDAANVGNAQVSLYDITALNVSKESDTQVRYSFVKGLLKKPVKTVTFDYGKQVPFAQKDTVEFTCPSVGRYIIVAQGEGCPANESYIQVISSSALALANLGDDADRHGVVVDPVSGAPQKDVAVYFKPWSRRSGETMLPGKTDDKGEIKLVTKENGAVQPRRGDDVYARWVSTSNWYDYSEKETIYDAQVFTSLKLYHPGDTVGYAVVLTRHTPQGRSLAENMPVKVLLRDANYQEVSSQTLTTDAWGRQQGSVVLPTAGLQGTFMLEAYVGEKFDNGIGSGRFEVSDYRLPTFHVENLKVLRPATPADSAVVTGKALTYANFPVADAKVAVSLAVRGSLWRWSPSTPVYATVDGKTDAQGNIKVVIPADVITSAPITGGYFTATVAVTSADGETSQGETGFNMGLPLTISCDIPAIINLDKPYSAEINAYDYLGEKKPVKLLYTLTGTNSAGRVPEITGSFEGGSFAEVIRTLAPGRYGLCVAAADSTLAAPVEGEYFTVYSPKADVSPTKSVIWSPQAAVVADERGEAEILFGSGIGDANVWMVVSAKDKPVYETRWIKTVPGMQTVKVHLPADSAEVLVQLCSMRDFSREVVRVNVLPASSRKSLDLKVETFRDKVQPGDIETLTFKVAGNEGATASGALMASMTNAALNQIAFSGLAPIRFPEYSRVTVPWITGWNFYSASITASQRAKWLTALNYSEPAWNFYGRSLYGSSGIRIRGTARMYANSAAVMAVDEVAAGTDDLNVVREHKAQLAVEEEAEAPAMKAAGVTESAAEDSGSLDEVVVTGYGTAKKKSETGSVAESDADASAAYRPSEIPMAFFNPMLTTDADGVATLQYTVPQANTTWLLSAVAYNADLLSAATSQEIVASKSLMVNLNAPGFLRGGDRVTVRASVMNNTDSLLSARGTIEVLDQGAGKVLASKDFALDSLASKGTSVVAVDYEADPMTAAVIFRVKASDGHFTDGEQALTRIIPSEQDVVRSTMFFVPSDSTSYTVQLDSVAAGGRAILQYTENPAWQVVTALPGLREKKIDSSIEAVHALFSARVADGLTRQFPEITHAIRRWAENPQDSMLVSNLMKNSDLRQVVLSATPWVTEALDETQRLQRLALLLDPRESERVAGAALETLSKTAVSGGGWCWTTSYPMVSEWATEEVLLTLGLLNQMGLMPDDSRLGKQVAAAWDYLDRETVKAFNKYPKADYTAYVYTRGLYPQMKRSTAVARVVNATVQQALASWRKGSLGQKAVYASLLNANGYTATARQILESLRQYATVTPEKGMWWQQLDREAVWRYGRIGTTAMVLRAFHEVEPKSADIDRIRQWLVLQKQNTDWGSSAVTSLVVATILRTGADWVVSPRNTAIHIGDALVEADRQEDISGQLTANVTPLLSQPRVMTIDRRSGYPSCGAVVTMERLPMSAIRAVGCAEASIVKSVSVSHNGAVWMPTDQVAVGDRVLVTLTITAEDDLDYVVVSDPRPAGCDLVSQLPTPVYSEGLCFYRENAADNTNLYIDRLPRGVYVLTYELFASRNGRFSTGASQLQSQYNPLVAAHSAGSILNIND